MLYLGSPWKVTEQRQVTGGEGNEDNTIPPNSTQHTVKGAGFLKILSSIRKRQTVQLVVPAGLVRRACAASAQN